MKKSIVPAMIAFAAWCAHASAHAAPRFAKVSDHCYSMTIQESGINVAAVVTDDGVLMVNPPPEPGLSSVMDALREITPKPVRWVVYTEPGLGRNPGARLFADGKALVLTRTNLLASSRSLPDEPAAPAPPPMPQLIFEAQMSLFPSNLEVRIIALGHKARSGADVVLFVPAEKVLITGSLFEAARFPEIDTASGGSPVGWIDGMQQAIDAVPLLKAAIPKAKPASENEPEKTLEEEVTVLPGRGESSDLQDMKDLLDSCKRLRADIARAVRYGRTSDSYLASAAADPYRRYGNLDSYAAKLFAALPD